MSSTKWRLFRPGPNVLTLRTSCESTQTLHWRHNGRDGVSNLQPHHCLFNHLFRRRSKKTSKRRVTGFCEGNSPAAGGFPAQMASNAENVANWWRHHVTLDLNNLEQSLANRESFLQDVFHICSQQQRIEQCPLSFICRNIFVKCFISFSYTSHHRYFVAVPVDGGAIKLGYSHMAC